MGDCLPLFCTINKVNMDTKQKPNKSLVDLLYNLKSQQSKTLDILRILESNPLFILMVNASVSEMTREYDIYATYYMALEMAISLVSLYIEDKEISVNSLMGMIDE